MSAQKHGMLVALLLGACAANPADAVAQTAQVPAQEHVCFEIVPARPDTLPKSAILLNKCTGNAYVLTSKPASRRNTKADAGAAYVWEPISIMEGAGQEQRAASGGRQGAKGKCFAYDNRLFCE